MVEINIHASAVRLEAAGAPFAAPPDCGVLLLGPSGAGKSDLTLRLIASGARLVADDRVLLQAIEGRLFARPPAALAGLLEVRGLGIVALPYAQTAELGLAVALGNNGDRLPEPELWRPQGLAATPALPLLRLDPFMASAPARIALAAAAHTQRLIREYRNDE